MNYGAQNRIQAKVKSVKEGDIMSLVKFEVIAPATMASVLTTESLEGLNLRIDPIMKRLVDAGPAPAAAAGSALS